MWAGTVEQEARPGTVRHQALDPAEQQCPSSTSMASVKHVWAYHGPGSCRLSSGL